MVTIRNYRHRRRIIDQYRLITFDYPTYTTFRELTDYDNQNNDEDAIAVVAVKLPDGNRIYKIRLDGQYEIDGTAHPMSEYDRDLALCRAAGLNQLAERACELRALAEPFMTAAGENPMDGVGERLLQLRDLAEGEADAPDDYGAPVEF